MPVPRLAGAESEILTVGATSQATTLSNPSSRGRTGFVSVTAIGADLWVVAGAAPVAVAGAQGFAVLAGQTRDFAMEPGDKLAIVQL
jgi:hypothetical protein